MSHIVFVPRLARRALAALPVLIAPAISLAQPAQPAPAQPAPAPPAPVQPAPGTAGSAAPVQPAPSTAGSAAPAPASTATTPPPAATNGTRRPSLLPQGPISPGMVARPAGPEAASEGRNIERTRGEFGARPTDVYAEDWWTFARPVLELHGYFRTRAELFHNFSLGRSDPASTALWARPADTSYNQWSNGTATPSNVALCGNSDYPFTKACSDKSQAMANMRFRLNPELHISDNLRIMSQIDLLDNVVLGSTPEGYTNTPNPSAGNTGYWRTSTYGYAPIGAFSQSQVEPTANQNSFRNSISVKRVWGEYVTPVGQLRFGRMPNHWGLGMLYNSGDGYDADYQSTVDRIMFTTAIRPLDLYVGGAWDFPYEGATSAALTQQQGQPYDLAQNDDVSQYVKMVARRRNPTLQRLDLSQGNLVVNGGLYMAYRNQFLDNEKLGLADGQNLGTDADTLKQGYVRRNFKAWTPDLWLQVLYKKFRFEAEGAMVAGSMDTIPGGSYKNVADTSNNGYKLRQYAIATQAELKTVEDRLRINFGWGWASGDPDLNTLSPGNGFQSKADSSKRTYSMFRMHPNHRVDLILFRHILNRVQGAYYFRPSVDYDFSRNPNGQRIGGGAAVIWSRASEFVQTPGHRRDLGVEIDLTLYYQSKDGLVNDDPDKMGGFYTMLQYGVLFPLWGLEYMPGEKDMATQQNIKLDTGAAQTLRWYAGIMF